MIKLEKGDEPTVLSRNTRRWTHAVLSKLAAGETPSRTEKNRYNHSDIKRALVAETHGKCAYCESKLRHVAYGDIEHIVPKSDSPAKWFSWPNLTLACDVCNTNKSRTSVDENTFIDPYEVDPEENFWQLGPIVFCRPGCDVAGVTERLLKLNRAELVERRHERITGLMRMLESFERCGNRDLRNLLWQEFTSEAQAHNEYAALARTVVAEARRRLDVV